MSSLKLIHFVLRLFQLIETAACRLWGLNCNFQLAINDTTIVLTI